MATVANSVGALARMTVIVGEHHGVGEHPGDDKLRARDVGQYFGEVGAR